MTPWVDVCLEKEMKYPVFTRSMVGKRRSKMLGQPSKALPYNYRLYVLFINMQISFFSKNGLYPGGLISDGAYNRRDLYVSNLGDLYPGGPVTGSVITGVLRYSNWHVGLNIWEIYFSLFFRLKFLRTNRFDLVCFDTVIFFARKKVYKCLTVCYYHVTYVFQSEPTLYSCLNFKELLAQKQARHLSLSDSNGIWTYDHLARKRTFNHLAKVFFYVQVVVGLNLVVVTLQMFWFTKWIGEREKLLQEKQVKIKQSHYKYRLCSPLPKFTCVLKDLVSKTIFSQFWNDNTNINSINGS